MFIGTAAWTIPKIESQSFPLTGTHLERYSQVLNAVEINSSFYNDHMSKSYAKWMKETPDDFKFSVKLNQRFTHNNDLKFSPVDLITSLQTIAYLEDKWRVLLVQFPRKQNFSAKYMERLYKNIRAVFHGMVALEARNLTWMEADAINLMKEYNILKVIADPEKCPGELVGNERYYRLHGSPEIYRSNYDEAYLEELYLEMQDQENKGHETWCIFDNTTFGHATSNALTIRNKGGFYDERRTGYYDNRTPTLYPFDQS